MKLTSQAQCGDAHGGNGESLLAHRGSPLRRTRGAGSPFDSSSVEATPMASYKAGSRRDTREAREQARKEVPGPSTIKTVTSITVIEAHSYHSRGSGRPAVTT